MWVSRQVTIRLWLAVISMVFATPIYSDEGLSMEFLEFLGEWESPEGELVDPFEFVKADENEEAELVYSEEDKKDE